MRDSWTIFLASWLKIITYYFIFNHLNYCLTSTYIIFCFFWVSFTFLILFINPIITFIYIYNVCFKCLFYFMYLDVMPAHMFVNHMHAWVPQVRRGLQVLWNWSEWGGELLCGYWESNSSPLGEQLALFITEPSIQPLY